MTIEGTQSSLRSKLGALLFSGIFAAAFGAGGVLGGIAPLVSTFALAWEVREWRPVEATVQSAELRVSKSSKGGPTYAVDAVYDYQVAGRSYQSKRVGLAPGSSSDNVGHWHQAWQQKLSNAKAQGSPVMAWVDPQRPSRAVLDRDVRWPMVLFHLPFALVFTAVGLVASFVFWSVLTGTVLPAPLRHAAQRSRGARGKPVGETPASTALFLGMFAFFWCGISFPMAGLVWTTQGNWGAKAAIMLFVVIGLTLIAGCLKATRAALLHRRV